MKRQMAVFSLGAVFLVCASALFAEDRLVPSVYPTIQAAIDDCNTGDVVIVEPNTYTGPGNRDLDFGGIAITVRSEDPNNPAVVAATVIDCQSGGRGFYFQNGETSSSVVAGLTITNGYAVYGGGIYCNGSSPTIRNCTFSTNTASMTGGGMENESCSPIVVNCVFTGNIANWGGGGMDNYDSSATVRSCIFSGNGAPAGGGMENLDSSPTIINCTLSGNYADQGGGIYNYGGSNPSVSNCILWGDSAPDEPEIYGDCSVSYSDVQGGCSGEGNIDADPCFADPAGGDYHLLEGSPCINAGDPGYSPAPGETDIDGEPRVMGIRVDMGADEFTAAAIPAIEITPTEFEFLANEAGPNPEAQILSIRNDRFGTLNWEITEDCPWLDAVPTSGESSGEVNEVTISVDVSGLAWGEYSCELTVSDPCALNSPQMVDVNLTVIGPVIELSAVVFEFLAGVGGPNPDDQELGIRNSGGGRMNWEIAEDCGWLSVEPNSGSSTGEIDTVALSVDVAGLAWGYYNCDLTISDSNAENNPRTAAVSLLVRGPIIELSTAEFAFAAEANGPNPAEQILTVGNGGGGTLNWEIAEECNWLSVEPNSGSVIGEINEVSLSVDISGLGVGIYDCELVVSDPNAENSPQVVAVTLTVHHPDELGVPSEYPTIQAAIDAAVDGNTVVIAPGTYTGAGNRDIDFKGKAITVRSMYPEDPDVVAATVIDCQGSLSEQHRGFYFHSGEGQDSVVAGLTITNGFAMAGGGMRINSNPTVMNCIFKSNMAKEDPEFWQGHWGGGISSFGHPTVIGCTFIGNQSFDFGGAWCGPAAAVTNCKFIGNSASKGGAMAWLGGTTVRDCTFSGNGAGMYGSAVSIDDTSPTLVNCAFWGNGDIVIDNAWFSYPTLRNCTFSGNTGPVICNDGMGSTTVTNCILWGNSGNDFSGSGFSVTYSCIEQVVPGTGNIHDDPCFVSGPEGDYYLSQTGAGQAYDSPCVDAGSDTASNLGLDTYTTRTNQFRDIGMVDMGYHYPTARPYVDVDGNWHVDFVDYAFLAGDWLECSEPCDVNYLPGDITKDGCVDMNDIKLLGDWWLDCYVGPAASPKPGDNTGGVDPNIVLSWWPGAGVLYHDVYFGTDGNGVAGAGHWSGEFMDTVADANFDPCTLELDNKYYWRIDEVGPACTTIGDVWTFRTWVEPNFVGWWKFDEVQGSTAYDSAGMHDGTLYAANWTTGQIGGALDFDGDDAVYLETSAGTDSPLNIYDTDLTITAWLKIRGTGGTVVARAKPSYTTYRLGVGTNTAFINTYTEGYGHWLLYTGEILNPYTWYHIVGVFERSAGTGYVYVDGVEQAHEALGPDPASNDAATKIGCRNDWSDGAFDGIIDDVRIYDRALSPEEIEQLYQAGL